MISYRARGRNLWVECSGAGCLSSDLCLRVTADGRYELDAPDAIPATSSERQSWSVMLPANLYDGQPHRVVLEITHAAAPIEKAVLSIAGSERVACGPPAPPGLPTAPAADPAALEDQARERQRERDFARSIPLWDRLCALRPERPEYPLALAADLQSAGRAAEADEVLRRAVRSHPNSFWPAFQWARVALSEGRLDAAEQRARRLLDRFGDKSASFELLGDIAVRQRDMHTAERCFGAALSIEPGNRNCARKSARARLYRALSQNFSGAAIRRGEGHDEADYAVLAINLDHNRERFSSIERAFADSPVPLRRIPGVRGGYLPSVASRRLTGPGELKKGTLGTFLAHVAAWETAAQLEFDRCLIVEDDASPIIDLPRQFAMLGIPGDFELCFVNDRMECRIGSHGDLPEKFQVRDPIEALAEWPHAKNAPGADGYFLSRTGAQKLLQFVDRDGFAGDVDWRLVCHSIPQGGHARFSRNSVAFNVLQKMDARFGGRLTAYTLLPSLILGSTRESIRLQEDRLGIVPMRHAGQ